MSHNKSLSTQEVAQILHVSISTIYELIRRGEINSCKIGRKVRFTQDDVNAYIARSRHEQSVLPVKHTVAGHEGESLLEILRSDAFRKEIKPFSVNDYRDPGKIVAEV